MFMFLKEVIISMMVMGDESDVMEYDRRRAELAV
tara:strand:+ start:71 stop:172 length:102 start_codon:yes stop_codon:yes gene_type:complete